MFILRIKPTADGVLAKYKGLLVALESFLSEADDYAQQFALVACTEVDRLLLAVAADFQNVFIQIDIKEAFLHTPLLFDEEILIRLRKISGVPRLNDALKRPKNLFMALSKPQNCGMKN